MRFSTPRTTPSDVLTPMAVLPSLMASRLYSTWKRRPSGEKVLLTDQPGVMHLYGFLAHLTPRSASRSLARLHGRAPKGRQYHILTVR